MTDEVYDTLQTAIRLAMVTLERGTPEGDNFAGSVVFSEMGDDPQWELNALHGMANLALILLFKLEKSTGMSPPETLQDIARRYRP